MKEKFYIGGMFILAGVLFLLSNFQIVSFDHSWPSFVLLPGLLFFFTFFEERKNLGLLMPAAILTCYGLLFFYCDYFGWEQMDYLWPVFILAPGIGFFLMYYLGTREKKLLIPGSILVFIGLINIGLQDMGSFFWPIVLIGVGLFLLLFKK
jgi:hypothetical protein